MLILYNFIQLLAFLLFFPIILGYVAVRRKYRSHILRRLGLGLQTLFCPSGQPKKTIWVHALSVGEVASALPLVDRLRRDYPDCRIVFSSSTRSGYSYARTLLSPSCEAVIACPLDILPICTFFIRTIRPDLFLLVETDFWPNLLRQLEKRAVPTLLVNARLSARSMAGYARYAFFFKPLFATFSAVTTQTAEDSRRFEALGVRPERIHTLGNLKYEPFAPANLGIADRFLGEVRAPILMAGSTHAGEEEMLVQAYVELRRSQSCRLVIAPRNPARAEEIQNLAEANGLSVQRRTQEAAFTADLFLLDTIGELLPFYRWAHICFVGGSLVAEGGHNPLEPARYGKPVLFGPDMSDFAEISAELLACGGAFQVRDATELKTALATLLGDSHLAAAAGEKARACLSARSGVIDSHLLLVGEFL